MSTNAVPSKSPISASGVAQLGGIAPLISTKTRVPRLRPDLLLRPRLIDFIHTHLDRRLILISAPAGYGKTSLLTGFAADTDLKVCWYTLDPFDQDLHVFLEYLVEAIAVRFPDFGHRSRALLRDIAEPSGDLYPIVTTMVREIYDRIEEHFVLILDDHHTVETQEYINEFLDLFVTYVDENCHLILASRTLPALPNLSLHVARRQAAGLSIDELRFTAAEVRALAKQNYGLGLNLEQAEILAQRTGGWITGLLLTAVSQWEQEKADLPDQGWVNVDLYDYLSRQVLDQQPADLRGFLMGSSVLDELSPDLCTTVLGINGSVAFIDQIRQRNLFVLDFGEDINHLRYHALFREFLRSSLQRQDEARFRQLMRRAAEAYANLGEWERAVSRYEMLKEYESVADIIDRTLIDLYDAGRWSTLAGWIDALPEQILEARPLFWLHRGMIHTERGEYAPALALFEQAERAFTAAEDTTRIARALASKGLIFRFQGRYAEAIAHCEEALALADGGTTQEKRVQALAHKNIGLCQLRLANLAEGRASLVRALRIYEELSAPFDMGTVHHDLGLVHELGGDLPGAVVHYQAALQRWQQLGNQGPWSNTLNGLGVVYYLQGKYEQAQKTLNEALDRAQKAGDLRVQAFTLASLGDLHSDLGAYELAQEAYSESLEVANRAHVGFITTYAQVLLANAQRLQGDPIQARKQLVAAMEYAKDRESAYEVALCRTSLGILAGEEGDLDDARQYLDQAIETFASGGFQQELSRASLHRAQAAFLAGEYDTALADLERALDLTDQLGFDQFLVVDGQHLQPMLRYGVEHDVKGDTLPRLLRRIEAHQALVTARPESVVQPESQCFLQVRALGKPYVELDGKSVQWTVAQSRDLFFFLLQHHEGLSKEQIGAAFWPDHSPQKLDGVFRSTLYRLRRGLFKECVVYEDGAYRFDRGTDYWFDVQAFDEALDQAGNSAALEEATAPLVQALKWYRGEYLEGIDADWVTVERERLRKRYLESMKLLAERYEKRRNLQRAINVYRKLEAADSFQEDVHRGLMRCFYQQGDRAAAIRQYQTCVEVLRDELGLSPEDETEELYLKIIG
jgi:LuxR family maltose regulon positive regulatory protein